VSKNKYCQDCGGALLNPARCSCGWKAKKETAEWRKDYPENCMVFGCKRKTDIVIQSNDSKITRCGECYDQDLRRANKQQLKVNQ
jgi:hypothetical protein